MEEKKLFLVRSTLSVYPSFYVEAPDILEATRIAKSVVDYYDNGKVVAIISAVDIPLLRLEIRNV